MQCSISLVEFCTKHTLCSPQGLICHDVLFLSHVLNLKFANLDATGEFDDIDLHNNVGGRKRKLSADCLNPYNFDAVTFLKYL